MRVNKRDAEALAWVSDMADTLIREILEQVSDVQLIRCPEPCAGGVERGFLSIYSTVEGAFHTELVFSAEPVLIARIASNMSGDPAPPQEEAVEYAMELFNMFCGRFISEIYRTTKAPARFYPPRYIWGEIQLDAASIETLFYRDEGGAWAKFAWTADAIERLLTRGKNNG